MSSLEIAALSRALDPARCAVEVGTRFALLLCAVAMALYGPWVLSPVAFLAIGILQYHILVLSHEAQHVLIARSKPLNDRIGAWLLAYPFGQPFHSERARHLKHHQTVGRPEDPDYYRYTVEDKRPWRDLLLYYLRLATYGKVVEYLSSTRRQASGQRATARGADRSLRELGLVAGAQLFVLALFSFAATPLHYFAFWLAPLLTVSLVLSEFREFCEHLSVPSSPLRLKTFRNPLWEQLLLGPCGFTYHGEHHLHPSIPHYLLPRVAAHYPESNEELEVHRSYFDVVAKCRADAGLNPCG
jgi:fatty acid desaturase